MERGLTQPAERQTSFRTPLCESYSKQYSNSRIALASYSSLRQNTITLYTILARIPRSTVFSSSHQDGMCPQSLLLLTSKNLHPHLLLLCSSWCTCRMTISTIDVNESEFGDKIISRITLIRHLPLLDYFSFIFTRNVTVRRVATLLCAPVAC